MNCIKCGGTMAMVFVKVLDKHYRFYRCKFCRFETRLIAIEDVIKDLLNTQQEESWQSEGKEPPSK